MRSPRSLKAAFTWWFAATLVVLYGVIAVALYVGEVRDARRFAVLTLKQEAETVADYVGSSGRLDPPEISAPEREPIPIWTRILERGRILAATPGTPPVPIAPPPKAGPPAGNEDAIVDVWYPPGHPAYVVVRHAIGRARPGASVETVGAIDRLLRAERRVLFGLLAIGLVVIPVAAAGGRQLAARALRPIEALVRDIRSLDPDRPGERLHPPAAAVAEVAALGGAFNELRARLDGSVEALRRFTADASHEIRNPLAVLRTGIEVALRHPRDAAEYHRLLTQNLQEIERLQAVLEGLLALAREREGAAVEPARAAVALAPLVAAVVETLSVFAGERGVRIAATLAPQLAVIGDERLVRLIVFNLLDNGVKHAPAQGEVRLSAAVDGAEVALVVADDGPGIPVDERARLFERFFRSGQAGRGAVGGLGLSVVRHAAETQGGSVRLLDREHGAAFEVRLPRGGS
jgi:two-component system OmpR family sensor kinase